MRDQDQRDQNQWDQDQLTQELGGTEPGSRGVAAIAADPGRSLVACDFDGCLSPIVGDPEQAYALPEAVEALGRVGHRTRVAIITGRPARTAVRLGRLTEVAGLERLVLLGQYGVERWDAAGDRFTIPPAPPEVDEFGRRLPEVLARAGHSDLYVEDKGRALAVHTRRAQDPAAALAAVTGPVLALAEELGLHAEPGRNVLEIRAPGQDKGDAMRRLVQEWDVANVAYAGDDLGDIPAFEAVGELRERGGQGVLVASASAEQDALVARADVSVDGPPGVAGWLSRLADLLGV